MLVASEEKYIPQLKHLWQTVFGDEEGYIDLFFKAAYFKSKTFAEFDGEKIVSVLYLMRSQIRFENNLYNGFYLYAAATDPSYRRKGLMGQLLKEAQQYTAAVGKDYISLVPGNEPLYDYYSKFGFQTAMHKYISTFKRESKDNEPLKNVTAEEYNKSRNKFTKNAFLWGEEELLYVLDCFSYYDIISYKAKDAVLILDKENSTVKELMCKRDDCEKVLSQINCDFVGDNITYESCFGKSKIPFGMIYPINKNLKRAWHMDDIYMNLALD